MAKPKLLTLNEFAACCRRFTSGSSMADERTEGLCPPRPRNGPVGLATRGLQDVVKLAPIIKDLIGHRLDPRWIRKALRVD